MANPVAAIKPDTAMEVGYVVVEIVAEGTDLVSAYIDLRGPDAEFEECAGEVSDEEDHRVPNETEARECHQRRTDTQRAGTPVAVLLWAVVAMIVAPIYRGWFTDSAALL